MNFNKIFDAFSYKILLKTCFFLMSRGCWRARRGNDGPGPRRCPALQAAAKVSGPLVGHRPPSSHQAELTSTLTLNCNVFSKRSSIYILYWDQIQFYKLKRGVFVSCVLCICLFRVYLCPSGITLNQESCTDKTQYNRMDN